MVSPFSKVIKNHWIVNSKWMNSIICEIYLSKAVWNMLKTMEMASDSSILWETCRQETYYGQSQHIFWMWFLYSCKEQLLEFLPYSSFSASHNVIWFVLPQTLLFHIHQAFAQGEPYLLLFSQKDEGGLGYKSWPRVHYGDDPTLSKSFTLFNKSWLINS